MTNLHFQSFLNTNIIQVVEMPLHGRQEPGYRFNIKITSYQYRKSHCGDKTILRLCFLHNGISYTGKTTSLYWIGALFILHSQYNGCWWPGDVKSYLLNMAGLRGCNYNNLFNTLRPRQNGSNFKRIFMNENIWIPIKISLKFVPKGPINNIPALVQIMAWRRPGDKPLSEPMMVNLPTHICVTRPQLVKQIANTFRSTSIWHQSDTSRWMDVESISFPRSLLSGKRP